MFNELIFAIHAAVVAGGAILALILGKEALISLISLYVVVSNLFVTKQITLFGFDTISTDVFTIGAVVGLNLLQEHYGKSAAQRAIAISFGLSILYIGLAQLHIAYIPNQFDTMHNHFAVILTPMLRIMLASVAAYLVSQIFDMQFYGFLKQATHGKHLVLRNIVSLATSQLLDTVLFSVMALYGAVHSIIPIILVSYSIKLLVILFSTPFIRLSNSVVRFIRHE